MALSKVDEIIMKNICIICSSKLPQPPSLGGAVPMLIQLIVDQNEINENFNLTCLSVFNDDALKISKKYKNTKFKYIKTSKISYLLDRITCFFLNVLKRTNKIYSWGFLFRTLSFRKGVKKDLIESNYDLLIFENSIPVFLCMKSRRLRKKYKDKFLYHTHCVPRKAFSSGKLLEQSKKVLCVSKYIEKATQNRFKKHKLSTEVLYNCVDTSLFKPTDISTRNSWRKEMGIKDNDFAVGFIGRISKDKGIVELIKAINLINDETVKLIIVGSTFYNADTKDKFSCELSNLSKDIKNRVIFTGYMQNTKTPLFYSSCDVICLPPVWEEPGAITNIEASACGCSIITTNSGGNSEYIGSGKSLILEKNDTDVLIKNIAESIICLKDNPELKKQFASRAYNWGKNQNRLEFYNRFLNAIELNKEGKNL